MAIDLEKARRETRGCAEVLHFNNAGAALMPEPVLRATVGHLELEARIGGYEAAERQRQAIHHVYDAAAVLLGCRPEEIAVVENATRAWDMVFYSLPLGPGDRVLTGVAEYASNYISLVQVARRTGARVEVIPDDEDGQISLPKLRAAIDERVKLIAITHVPTNGGLVNPAEAVGQVARQAGVTYLLDGCQSAGQMPIDVGRIGCDAFSATGRKFLRGPRGTGFLYCRGSLAERLEPVLLDLHAATIRGPDLYDIRAGARRFENWETNVAGKLGLAAAIDYALGWGLEAIERRVVELAAALRRRLAGTPGVTVHDRGQRKCGIVTFSLAGLEAEAVKRALGGQGMNVSVSSSAFAPFAPRARAAPAFVRASVHYYNSEDEVGRFCQAVAALA